MRVFAIRLGDWVEIRSSEKAPVALTSSFPVKGTRKVYEAQDGVWGMYDKPFKQRLKVVAHEGGKYLCSMKLEAFTRLMEVGGKPMKKGEMIELKGVWVDSFLNSKRRAKIVATKG